MSFDSRKIDRAFPLLSTTDPAGIDFAVVLQERGTIALARGDYASARSDLEWSLDLKEQSGNAASENVGSSALALGHVLFDIGDLQAAGKRYQQALDLFNEAYGPESAAAGSALCCLAQTYRRKGDFDRSRDAYEETFRIFEKRLEPDHPNFLKAINGYAILLATTGELSEARAAFDRALVIKERTLGPEHPSVAIALNNLAHVHFDLNEYEPARMRYEQCLSIREKSMGPHHPHLVETRINLALVLYELGEYGRAFDLSLEAERSGREHFLLTARGLSEREALDYSAVRASGLDLALSIPTEELSPERRRNLWNAVVRSRALVLDEMAGRHRLEGAAADPVLAALADSLDSARTTLAQLQVRGSLLNDENPYEEQLSSAEIRKEKFERRLGEASGYFRSTTPNLPAGLEAVAASIPDNSSVVSYLRYLEKTDGIDESTPSFVVLILRKGDEFPRIIPIGDAEEIDALVYDWKEEASRGALLPGRSDEQSLGRYRSAARALGERIWAPVASELGTPERVYLVPDGSIGLVNFAALLDTNGSFLVENGPLLQYISVERDLIYGAWQEKAGSGLLALGNPDFNSPGDKAGGDHLAKSETGNAGLPSGPFFQGLRSNCGELGALQFESLPGSASEIEEICRLWDKIGGSGSASTTILTGRNATESRLRQAALRKEVLHISTHGFFLDGSCPSLIAGVRGVGLLVEDEPGGRKSKGDGAFALSGLALAGANRREEAGPDEEDGILTAEEIATFDLSGVRWAVLSACETGLGTIRAGEGILGLRRAFQIAGARTLITSLWAVGDQATREWMNILYEGRFLNGMDTMESVRAADLSVLRRLRQDGESVHPFYWAGFIAAGDWR